MLSVTNNRYVILLLMNVVLLVVGCFLEPIASISILVPVLMPVVLKVGIDPVHFGVVMALNLMIGLLHPPLGMVLFVLSRIAKLSLERTRGDPALADPASMLADRHHADPGTDPVAAAHGRADQIRRRGVQLGNGGRPVGVGFRLPIEQQEHDDRRSQRGEIRCAQSMTRRAALKTAALATTALIAAPYVRGAGGGELSIGFWDHWVPSANSATKS